MSSSSSRRSIPAMDIISDLPEPILCHILSFLPTKKAATTSILSKRWKSLWLSVLTLHFDDKIFKNFDNINFRLADNFQKSVYLTLFKLRDKNTSIHSFTFICRGQGFHRFLGKDFNRILTFVMERGVQNLHFEILLGNHQIRLIPYCNTLRVLTLSNLRMQDFDRLDFPCVKTLNLNYVCFKDHQHIVKFLSGFPVLENLQTDLCLNYMGRKIQNVYSNPLPNFVNAKISARHKQMGLVCETMIMQSQPSMLPVLHNFTDLEISIHDLHHSNRQCRSLLGILPYFPKLRHFTIQDCARESELNCICWKWFLLPTTVPECLSSQLQTCCIKGDRDTLCFFGFASYIMKHSKVLDTMRINSTIRSNNPKMMTMLSSFTWGSPTCELLFG